MKKFIYITFNMKYILLSVFMFLSFDLFSISLPLKKIKLTSTFGESRKDHFHNGIDLGYTQNVYSIDKSKIIFYYDKADFPFDNYMGSGNYVVLDHKKTRSYYMHLKDNSINKTNYIIDEGVYIGITGNTGHSYGSHLHFTIEKKHPFEILNPLIFYKNEIEDKVKPRIEKFFIKVDDSSLMPVMGSYTIKEGSKLSLYIKTYDLIQNVPYKMGPYKITCFINDEKYLEYKFDKLYLKDNNYYIKPNYTFEDIYHEQYIYKLGDFFIEEKKYNIIIKVEDISGNKSQIERQLIIK